MSRPRYLSDALNLCWREVSKAGAAHACLVCQKTDGSSPQLEFRIDANGDSSCVEWLPRTSQNFRDEALFFENRKCLGFFTGPKESRWDSELVVDGHGDAAFSGAVEFGDDDAVERTGFVKFLGLLQRVGAGGGIHDEQGEMRCRLVLLGDGAAVEPKEMIRSEEESAVYGSSTSTASSFHAPSFPSSRVSIRISIGLDRDFDCGR